MKVNKKGERREGGPFMAFRCAAYQPCVASAESRRYHSPHIRPLVVSPLEHPERVLSPWGFVVCGVRELISEGAR